MSINKFQISRDSAALYITVVIKDRLPAFRTDKIKTIVCQGLNEARDSGKFLIFAYVIMPDHMHLITDCPNKSADVLRYLKGITAKRVIDYLKENKYEGSLAKLRHPQWKRKHEYSLWQQEKNVFSIFSEAVFMQKVNYIHLNPVRAGFVEKAVDYRWSSGRFWQRCEAEDEPLRVDIDRIQWRSRGVAPNFWESLREGRRPSAHQRAKPELLSSFLRRVQLIVATGTPKHLVSALQYHFRDRVFGGVRH